PVPLICFFPDDALPTSKPRLIPIDSCTPAVQQVLHMAVRPHEDLFSLMPNHVHLLLREKEWHIGDIMKSIASSYVFCFNKKYGRIGHLFQDRFKSEPCDDMSYFFTLFR
ncbi:MAG: transposase, partial [Prevotella sp.]|nr:transposase [Prevotella sp.]